MISRLDPRPLLGRLNDYRRRQRRRLHESNRGRAARHLHPPPGGGRPDHDVPPAPADADVARPWHHGRPTAHQDSLPFPPGEVSSGEPTESGTPERAVPYGLAGTPFDKQSPFYFGFLATFGVMIAWSLFRLLGQLTTTMTILIVAFFLTLALNPIVEWGVSRGLRRAWSVLMVFAGLIGTVILIGLVVVPPVVAEGTALLGQAPDYVDQLLRTRWLQDLDRDYEVIDKVQQEFTKRVQDGSLIAQIFGGVLGAGKAVVNGVFQFLTILILTLYFLATLPRIKNAAYAAVPASRRLRIMSLSEEIMRRTGAYAAGQGLVATVNGLLSFIMMSIVGIPYAAVLGVMVGLLGLIPMVGATLGAVLVGVIAFLDEPRKALIILVYYVIYQQIENYVIVPRVMASTVSVPGALTIVAALTGGTILGVLGALLAIPVAAGLLLLYEEVLLPRQARH